MCDLMGGCRPLLLFLLLVVLGERLPDSSEHAQAGSPMYCLRIRLHDAVELLQPFEEGLLLREGGVIRDSCHHLARKGHGAGGVVLLAGSTRQSSELPKEERPSQHIRWHGGHASPLGLLLPLACLMQLWKVVLSDCSEGRRA